MPNAKVLKEKQKIVEELTEKLRSSAGVLVNYSGITVNEDTEMRVKMREAGVDYAVVKNTLMKLAIKNVGFEELDPVLNGTTSLAVSYDDPIAPARLIKEYVEKLADYFEIKAGFMDGRVLSADEVNALASIPPLPILQAKLLGTMLAPVATLAMVIKAIAEKGGESVVAEIAPDAEAPSTENSAAPAETAPKEAATPAVTASEATAKETASPAEDVAPAESAAEDTAKEAEAPKQDAAPAKTAAKATAKKAEAPVEDAAPAPAKKSTKATAKKAAAPEEDAAPPESAAEAPAEETPAD